MMSKTKAYNSKNIFALLIAFIFIFLLLHYLAVTLHQTQKINAEIDSIRIENKRLYEEIVQKKRKLSYLKTPERIDKDAKTQIGKRGENERSITFIKRKSFVSNTHVPQKEYPTLNQVISNNEITPKNYTQKWYKLLFTNQVSLTTLRKKQE